MKKPKRKSIVRQAVEKLRSMAIWGRSKHDDKAANSGKPLRNVIYSRSTLNNYLAVARQFTIWAREKYGCRDLPDAEPHTGDYLKERIDAGLSAWTIRHDAAALAKLFQKSTTELGVTLPVRHRSNVKQHRTEASFKYFSVKRNADLVAFCRSCGLRRHELAALRPDDVFQRANSTFVHVKQGKGGKERTVRALDDVPFQLAQKAISEGRSLVFEHFPKAAPIHRFRGDFAKSLYQKVARDVSSLPPKEQYHCRLDMSGVTLDRRAMGIVSAALGHSRLDVVTNYLKEPLS